MARYNKIFAGPTSENTPQVHEATSAVAVKPGRVVVNSGSAFALAGATTKGRMFVVAENYLAMKDVDTDYAIGETIMAYELLDEQVFRARLATGENASAVGIELSAAANGELQIAAATEFVVAFAGEVYNNTSGSGQLINIRAARGYIKPA